jgi:hypothetical protein
MVLEFSITYKEPCHPDDSLPKAEERRELVVDYGK